MFVNGQPLDDKRFLRLSEYVQHEDVFVPTQTLLHALEYHANLRLGPAVSPREKRKRIDALVHVSG
jgi:ABC-type multidrug transport system ATPase subunit